MIQSSEFFQVDLGPLLELPFLLKKLHYAAGLHTDPHVDWRHRRKSFKNSEI